MTDFNVRSGYEADDCMGLLTDIASHTREISAEETLRALIVSGRDEIRQYSVLRLVRQFDRVPEWSKRDEVNFYLPCPVEAGPVGSAERPFDWTFGRINRIWKENALGREMDVPDYYYQSLRRGLGGTIQADGVEIPLDVAKWEPPMEFYDCFHFGSSASEDASAIPLVVEDNAMVLPANFSDYRTLYAVLDNGSQVGFDVGALVATRAGSFMRGGETFDWDLDSRRMVVRKPGGSHNLQSGRLDSGEVSSSGDEERLCIEYCFTVGDKATHLPKVVLDEYGELIWRGALRRMPDKFLVDSRQMVEFHYMQRQERAVWRQAGGMRLLPSTPIIGLYYGRW